MSADGNLIDPLGVPEPLYTAGGVGRRLKTWRPSNAGPNVVTLASQGLIRARARAAARNDPWAGTALDKLVSNEIGTGIQAKTKYGDDAFKAAAKKLWDRWTKIADADGIFDFYGLQSLIVREWHEAGEVFIRIRNRLPSDGLPVPLQLQVIEAEQCPANYYASASNGNYIRAGIEFNLIGQRVAYWMYNQHPGDVLFDNINGLQLKRIPAEQILHVYEPTRAGQIRGIPLMTSTLVRMFNIDNFDDAVLERQKIGNLFAGWYTQPSGDPELEDSPLADASTGVACDGTPMAGLEPGTMQELPPGVEPKFSSPPDAGSNYAPYMRSQLMAVSARLGIPYEVLTGDLNGVSDRALKLILNEFRRIVEQRQWLVLIPQFCQRVRDAWWDAAVLDGAIDVPGYAKNRDDVLDTTWVPQGFPYSHPVQDVDSDIKAVRAGFKSRSSVILNNGDDPDETSREMIDDNAFADKNNLILDTDPRYISDKGAFNVIPAGAKDAETDDETPAAAPAPPANKPTPQPTPKAK